jgi:hypothetical protein
MIYTEQMKAYVSLWMDSRELFMKLTAESKIIPLHSSTLFDEEYRNLSQGGLVLLK